MTIIFRSNANSNIGFGLDYHIGRLFRVSTDYYNFDNPVLDISASYPIFSILDVSLGVDNVLDSSNKTYLSTMTIHLPR